MVLPLAPALNTINWKAKYYRSNLQYIQPFFNLIISSNCTHIALPYIWTNGEGQRKKKWRWEKETRKNSIVDKWDPLEKITSTIGMWKSNKHLTPLIFNKIMGLELTYRAPPYHCHCQCISNFTMSNSIFPYRTNFVINLIKSCHSMFNE